MTSPSRTGEQAPVLSASNISKRYTRTLALDDVSLTVAPRDIHALLGGNGSGKSTLIKILAGVEQADGDGLIQMGDASVPVHMWSPRVAHDAGIRVVHQDPGIFLDMSVADNFAAGHGYMTGFGYRVKVAQWHDHVRNTLARLDIDASPATQASRLRPSTRTMIAIARALQDRFNGEREGLLILDEPTAALPRGEVELLFSALRRFAAQGQSILFVSHRLTEVLSLCSNVTVLRDGTRIVSRPTAGLDEIALSELVAGRKLANVVHRSERDFAEQPVSLQTKALSLGPLRKLDISVRRGEVVGIAGLLGSGRTTLLRYMFGDLHAEQGELIIDGRPVTLRGPADAIERGIGLVPEDRGKDALFPSMTLDNNLAASVVRRYWRRGVLRTAPQRHESRALLAEFKIKAQDLSQPPTALSGGNQQKMVLARWLRTKPKVLLLDNPTQGVDVGAREDIHGLIRNALQDGTAVIIVSDDYDELARVSDRIAILRDGQIASVLSGSDITADRIARAIYSAAPTLSSNREETHEPA